ncbi:MAG: hypothetical protein ACOZDD_01305 [Bacteroidota bacterium]
MKSKLLKISFAITICSIWFAHAAAQSTTTAGVRLSALWFTPELMDGRYNSYLGTGLGFSAGIFFEDQLKPRLISVAEIGFTRLGTEVAVSHYSGGGHGGYGSVSSSFNGKVHFDYLSLSAGVKYFLSDRLFGYPFLDVSRSVDGSVKINKTTYHAGLRFGYKFYSFDINLGYVYGLKNQGSVYSNEAGSGTGLNHRNRYWQGSVSIPIRKF